MKPLPLLALTFTALLFGGAQGFSQKAYSPSPEKGKIMRAAVGRIDAAVSGMLQSKGMAYNPPLNDHMFLRRIYVDVQGAIPSYELAVQFLNNQSPYKRSGLISWLLGQPGYVSHLYNYFADTLRIQSEVPGTVLRTDAFSKWFKDSLQKNRPYNKIVYDMMTANSNRGTFADFGKMNSKYESMKVTFTDDAIVQGGNVTLPVRVVGLTKNGNSETYNGKAVLKKGSGDNAKYQITELDLDQEAN